MTVALLGMERGGARKPSKRACKSSARRKSCVGRTADEAPRLSSEGPMECSLCNAWTRCRSIAMPQEFIAVVSAQAGGGLAKLGGSHNAEHAREQARPQ